MKMYVKTKELGPIGDGVCPAHPLDLPMFGVHNLHLVVYPSPLQNWSFVLGRFGDFHLVVWSSQFVFGSSPPPRNRSSVVGRFGDFHLVVWCSQFAFGSLPPPPQIDHL